MNALYDKPARDMMNNQFIWDKDMVLAAWTGEPMYVPTHVTLAHLRSATGAIEVGVSLPITERTVAPDGTGQTNSVVIPGIPIGPDVTWFTLIATKTTPELGELILFIDEAVGLPFEPNGLDLIVQPDWITKRGWFRP